MKKILFNVFRYEKIVTNKLDFIDLFLLDYIRNSEEGYFKNFKMFVEIDYNNIIEELKILQIQLKKEDILTKLDILVTKEFLLKDSETAFSYTHNYINLMS